MTRLFTPKNRRLVSYLSTHKVESLAELARATKRAESNLSRTIRKFEQLGLMSLTPGDGRTRVPTLAVKALRFELDIATGAIRILGADRLDSPPPG